ETANWGVARKAGCAIHHVRRLDAVGRNGAPTRPSPRQTAGETHHPRADVRSLERTVKRLIPCSTLLALLTLVACGGSSKAAASPASDTEENGAEPNGVCSDLNGCNG